MDLEPGICIFCEKNDNVLKVDDSLKFIPCLSKIFNRSTRSSLEGSDPKICSVCAGEIRHLIKFHEKHTKCVRSKDVCFVCGNRSIFCMKAEDVSESLGEELKSLEESFYRKYLTREILCFECVYYLKSWHRILNITLSKELVGNLLPARKRVSFSPVKKFIEFGSSSPIHLSMIASPDATPEPKSPRSSLRHNSRKNTLESQLKHLASVSRILREEEKLNIDENADIKMLDEIPYILIKPESKIPQDILLEYKPEVPNQFSRVVTRFGNVPKIKPLILQYQSEKPNNDSNEEEEEEVPKKAKQTKVVPKKTVAIKEAKKNIRKPGPISGTRIKISSMIFKPCKPVKECYEATCEKCNEMFDNPTEYHAHVFKHQNKKQAKVEVFKEDLEKTLTGIKERLSTSSTESGKNEHNGFEETMDVDMEESGEDIEKVVENEEKKSADKKEKEQMEVENNIDYTATNEEDTKKVTKRRPPTRRKSSVFDISPLEADESEDDTNNKDVDGGVEDLTSDKVQLSAQSKINMQKTSAKRKTNDNIEDSKNEPETESADKLNQNDVSNDENDLNLPNDNDKTNANQEDQSELINENTTEDDEEKEDSDISEQEDIPEEKSNEDELSIDKTESEVRNDTNVDSENLDGNKESESQEKLDNELEKIINGEDNSDNGSEASNVENQNDFSLEIPSCESKDETSSNLKTKDITIDDSCEENGEISENDESDREKSKDDVEYDDETIDYKKNSEEVTRRSDTQKSEDDLREVSESKSSESSNTLQTIADIFGDPTESNRDEEDELLSIRKAIESFSTSELNSDLPQQTSTKRKREDSFEEHSAKIPKLSVEIQASE